jgi:hypothetical protein
LSGPRPLMPRKSRYAGQPIDISSRRSIEIQSAEGTAAAIDPADTHVTVNYFYHEGQFWQAKIPLDGVADVYGQVFNFSEPKTRQGPQGPEVVFDKHGLPKRSIPILNHIQSRFVLKPPCTVDLFPLHDGPACDPAHRIADFIYTSEAVGPAGITFSVRDGMAGNLISAHRFLSTQEMVFERIVLENQYVTESARLPIDAHQKRALLTESLLRSHRAAMHERYFLFRIFGTNNCTSGPFQILDRVLDYSILQRLGAIFYRLPLNPRLYLRIRGLDQDPTVRKLVRQEFQSYIQDPATQDRKRRVEAARQDS